MSKRFVSIWFYHLKTDWFSLREPALKSVPFILSSPVHGRLVITAVNKIAEAQGIFNGMTVADARAIHPELIVKDDQPDLPAKLLAKLGEWCIRFSPVIAIDGEDGLLLDVTGCTHLWEGDYAYVAAIVKRLRDRGYDVRGAIADTIGAAWALARFEKRALIVEPGKHRDALLPLPPASLRLEPLVVDRLHRLGLRQVRDFISMPSSALLRRFGQHTIMRISQATGLIEEYLQPLSPPVPYQERLTCMEPISTATGIRIALERLLDMMCTRLRKEALGLRSAVFHYYTMDGKTASIAIGTSRPSSNQQHLLRLFENKLDSVAPGPGIELFILDAPVTEELNPAQEKLWETSGGLQDVRLGELIDRLAGRIGNNQVRRYLPAEHYWPERSIRIADGLEQQPSTAWKSDRPRPLQLLNDPERIEVMAPIPDYPPMLFRHQGKLHRIVRADGPERIEQEWWIQQGEHRDYYCVEDEEAGRYWLFRSGHYSGDRSPEWFIHGYFA